MKKVEKIIKKCLFCQKEFITTNAKILRGSGKYCSMDCHKETLKKRVVSTYTSFKNCKFFFV